MWGGLRAWAALIVVAAGVTGALVFQRRDDAARQHTGAGEFTGSVHRRADDEVLVPQSPQPFKVPTAATGGVIAALPDSSAPEASATFQRSFSPVGALLPPLPEGASLPVAEPAPAAQDASPVTHTIADGDTLTKLALKYLGSADRYQEIFELNRDVLASPDLLPIGKTLMIPLGNRPASGLSARVTDMPKLAPIPPGLLRGTN